MRSLGYAVLAALMMFVPATAKAALLDLNSFGYERAAVVTEATPATISIFGGALLFANDPASILQINSFDLTDPAQAAFVLFGAGELSSSLAGADAQADMTGTIQFLFRNVTGIGEFAALDGRTILAELFGTGISLTGDHFVTDGTLRLTALRPVAAVPLPAAGLMLLVGLFGMGVLRRR
ncbi:VPLPA-CTERM sorting domain-containing protein [Roseobacter sinensis]|uniref:VPLPA-CTERM sorting domain-containing protein n=1 Tax=Roseobacter sinensis TaxID=2931391 RepID=A0ABT3BJR2_9RHOB|nr:VPLPA-CTERM sorting domain-containing protein [Roseobacter sp. WL0113]MCV3273814.1 VPLPA-CTERM sorting domain-containing protein [Roseobacter sp. WL0113]